MPVSELYHEVPQPFRIQKRLVLNQCFKRVKEDAGVIDRLAYVTFGGEDLYDVMDLVSVFDIRNHEFSIISYEQNKDRAIRSRSCPVASTLSRVETVNIEIVPSEFPENLRPLFKIRQSRRFVYFLDYTGNFARRQADTLTTLLNSTLLREDDFLLITSCLSPRIVHQSRFMITFKPSFKLFYGTAVTIDQEFKARNHVDLLVEMTMSRHERGSMEMQQRSRISANLLRKFKYRDSKAPMGLWLYRMESKKERLALLNDAPFEEFPHAFKKVEEREVDVPNIFD